MAATERYSAYPDRVSPSRSWKPSNRWRWIVMSSCACISPIPRLSSERPRGSWRQGSILLSLIRIGRQQDRSPIAIRTAVRWCLLRLSSVSTNPRRAPHRASIGPPRNAEDHRGRVHRWPSSALDRGSYFLKASFTCSAASLRLDFAWSSLPSASVLSSPVALPRPSLALPAMSSILLLTLSWAPMSFSSLCCGHCAVRRYRYPATAPAKPDMRDWHNAGCDPGRLPERRVEHGRLVRRGRQGRDHRVQRSPCRPRRRRGAAGAVRRGVRHA